MTPGPHELHRLFTAKADGTITPEEHERLAALLRESAEARQSWFAFLDAEEALLAWAKREGARAENGPTLMPAPVPAVPALRGRGWLLAIAATVLVSGGALLLWTGRERPVSPSGANLRMSNEATTSAVAMLTRGVDLEWEAGSAAPGPREPLSPGELRLHRGIAELEFFHGARLCIEGPATVRLISAGEVFCSRGRFSADVPPHARGFRIRTPQGDLVDLGTQFGLDLNRPTPELHVFKGEVEWHRASAPARLLTTGQATSLAGAERNGGLAADAGAFAFSHDLDSRVVSSQRAKFERWTAASAQWNTDPALRVRFDFQDGDGARSLRNTASQATDLTPATIVGCAWSQGRWPGKQALQFRSISDRVRLTLAGEFRQLTFSASVQLHGLNIRQSSLCMSEGVAAGAVHWQILHDGALCLGLGLPERGVWEDYISPVVFTPERLGQWVLLATVYDLERREVAFYVNGNAISRLPIKRPGPLTPRLVELGNWTPSPDKLQQPVRSFAGCIDEFSVFARALGAEEVRRLVP